MLGNSLSACYLAHYTINRQINHVPALLKVYSLISSIVSPKLLLLYISCWPRETNSFTHDYVGFYLVKSFTLSVFAVKIPLDAYVMDFVFSERENGGIFDNRDTMDYHIPVSGGIVKEPPLHIVHVAVEMAPIAKVISVHAIVFMALNACQ